MKLFPDLFNRKTKRTIVTKSGVERLLPAPGTERQLATSSSSKLKEAREKLVLGARADAMKVFRKMKHQFADPNKCYRELVQNAMDAGTDRMYFEFRMEYPLQGEHIVKYCQLFEKELQRAATSPLYVAAGLEELLLKSNGESHFIQSILGAGYSRQAQEKWYQLRGGTTDSYGKLVRDEWKLVHTKQEHSELYNTPIRINRFGFSREVFALLRQPLERMRYLDKIVELNGAVRLGRLPGWSKSPHDTESWNGLLHRRYALLKESIASETDGVLERLHKLHAEPEEKYAERMQEAAQAIPLQKRPLEERTLFPQLENLQPLETPLDALIRENDRARLTITAEDFGNGMSHEDRDKFLKSIFASSKTNDYEQTGRFGVGFISVFALNPERVIVESTKGNDRWEYHFLKETEDAVPGQLYEPEHPRAKGTKITIHLPDKPLREAKQIITDAHDHLRHDCGHREQPIYVNGVKINREFDIPVPLKVRFGKRGVEGVVGLVRSHEVQYMLENNRLVLEEKHQVLDQSLLLPRFGYHVLVSSQYLNYDIARETVQRDVNFEHVVRLIKSQYENLATEVFRALEKQYRAIHERKPGERLNFQIESLAWDFAQEYIMQKMKLAQEKSRRKKHRRLLEMLPEGILQSTVLYTVDRKETRVRDLLEYLTEQKDKFIYLGSRKDELTDILHAQGKKVFLAGDLAKYSDAGQDWEKRRQMLETFGELKYVDYIYKSSQVSDDLRKEEEQFLHHFSRILRASPLGKHFPTATASHFYDGPAKPFRRAFFSGTQFQSLYFETEDYSKEQQAQGKAEQKSNQNSVVHWGKTIDNLIEDVMNSFWGAPAPGPQTTIAINISNPYIRQLMRHERLFHDGLSYNLLLQAIAQNEYCQSMPLALYLCREEQKKLGTWKFNRKSLEEHYTRQYQQQSTEREQRGQYDDD